MEVCIDLYIQLLLTPDLLTILDKIPLSSHNFEAAKKLSVLSGLDLVQATVLVKYCLYKQMNSLAGIQFEMLGSIICGFDSLKKNLSKINLDKQHSVCYNFVLLFLLFSSNIMFFDPFYSLMDIYCLFGMVSKLPPSGGGNGWQPPSQSLLERAAHAAEDAIIEAIYRFFRNFADAVLEVGSGIISTRLYAFGSGAVQVFVQHTMNALLGLGVLGVSGYFVINGPSNVFQILQNGFRAICLP